MYRRLGAPRRGEGALWSDVDRRRRCSVGAVAADDRIEAWWEASGGDVVPDREVEHLPLGLAGREGDGRGVQHDLASDHAAGWAADVVEEGHRPRVGGAQLRDDVACERIVDADGNGEESSVDRARGSRRHDLDRDVESRGDEGDGGGIGGWSRAGVGDAIRSAIHGAEALLEELVARVAADAEERVEHLVADVATVEGGPIGEDDLIARARPVAEHGLAVAGEGVDVRDAVEGHVGEHAGDAGARFRHRPPAGVDFGSGHRDCARRELHRGREAAGGERGGEGSGGAEASEVHGAAEARARGKRRAEAGTRGGDE